MVAVRKNSLSRSATQEVESAIKVWLRIAHDRDGGRKARRQNSNNVCWEGSQVIRKVLQEESSDDENIEIPTQDSSSDDDNYLEKIIEEANIEMETEREIDNTSILEGDFVLVELKRKKSVRHYVAEIIKNFGEGHFEVIYEEDAGL
ncbi:hypothetical protein RN001_005173 [Aquatica leii]|uniref:Uncharacterized protein n=1 Tax=Aquatica leii TaxID=1421715 RepID=A0AAN7Q060_9COLE|nr:hypothetical protein RN001_005173 [Aquatica leii]